MIKKIEPSAIPGKASARESNVLRDLAEFMKSDWLACEVDTSKYVNQDSARASYGNAAKRSGINVTVIERDKRVFLVKEAAE